MGRLLDLAGGISPPVRARAREATDKEAQEILRLLTLLLPGEAHPDLPEALALALANPDAHLEGLRASRPPPAP